LPGIVLHPKLPLWVFWARITDFISGQRGPLKNDAEQRISFGQFLGDKNYDKSILRFGTEHIPSPR